MSLASCVFIIKTPLHCIAIHSLSNDNHLFLSYCWGSLDDFIRRQGHHRFLVCCYLATFFIICYITLRLCHHRKAPAVIFWRTYAVIIRVPAILVLLLSEFLSLRSRKTHDKQEAESISRGRDNVMTGI